MLNSIANSLGFGSGLDVSKLVTDLAAASRSPKIQAFDARARTMQAKISAVTQARSDLESFSSSMATVVAGGTLQSQPSVSDDSAVTATAAPGVRLGNFAGEIAVAKLAKSQSLYSSTLSSATNSIGQGALTVSVGSTSFSITIDASNDSLTGLASAINASGSGVKANIATDGSGSRLVLKGDTGSAKSFAVTGQAGNDPGLDRFLYSGPSSTMTLAQAAQDAEFTLDQIPYTRPTNSFSDVILGVTVTLKKAAPSAPIAIGSRRPTEAIRNTLTDFVSVFNQMKQDIATARTATNSDHNLRVLDQQLSRFISLPLTSDGGPKSLSEIGITTNRDGTISLNAAKFDAAVAANPDAVEALFSPTRDASHTEATDPGISAAFKALVTETTSENVGLSSLKARLDKESANLVKDRERMETREAAYAARLTLQYGSLDAKVGALKATQSYLDQQIKLWTQSR
jgi:flagellar hook-associated protein 2